MRNLVLSKINKIKKEQKNFVTKKWRSFKINRIPIKDVDFNQLQDEILLDYYVYIYNWNERYSD